MGTAVLRSHDCLNGRLHVEAFRPDLRPAMKPSRKKPARSPPPSPPTPPARRAPPRPNPSAPLKPRSGRRVSFADKENHTVVKATSRNLVMEEVTILKRGEELKPVNGRSDGGSVPELCPAARIGPEPEILPKGIRFAGPIAASAYAGPGFFSSPAPSALPFPALFLNKDRADEATRGLRGLLRLDALPSV